MTKKKDLFKVKSLVKDLERFKKDCERVLHFKKLLKDAQFLKKIAQDIKELAKSKKAKKELSPLLNTHWSTPFHEDISLLEAANDLEYQADLSYIIENMVQSHEMDLELTTLINKLHDAVRF